MKYLITNNALEPGKLSDVLEVQAKLLNAVISAGNQRFNSKATKILFLCWGSCGATASEFSEAVRLLKNSIPALIYGSYYIEFLHKNGCKNVDQIKVY